MSESRLPAFDATSAVIPPVMRFEAGLVRSIAPMENCVILLSELVGVQEVSAIEFTQITVRTMIKRQREQREPDRHAEKQMGEPDAEQAEDGHADIGNPERQLDTRQDILAFAPSSLPRRFLNTLVKISGLPASATSEPTTIMVTPHQSDH